MSRSRAVDPPPEQIELETVTNWRVVGAGAGILVLFLSVPCALSLFSNSHRELPPAPAKDLPRAISAEPSSPVQPLAAIPPQASFPPLEPYLARKAPPLPDANKYSVPAPPVAIASAPVATDPVTSESNPALPAPHAATFKRTTDPHRIEEHNLVKLLRTEVPEIKLDAEAGYSKELLAPSAKAHALLDLLTRRADLSGLPARGAADCQLSPKAAETLGNLSRDIALWRPLLDVASRSDSGPLEAQPAVFAIEGRLASQKDWSTPAGVSTLEQVLQAETPDIRLMMVRHLGTVKCPEADAALARRAAFDVCQEVRDAAIEAIKERPSEVVRTTLLRAFRHPWAPAAKYAAEAIVEVNYKDAIGELAKLADLPDPAAPVYDPAKKKWFKSELVRVNHLRNCLLCHAPSSDLSDPVRSPIPEPGRRRPRAYCDGSSKAASVRADITYLRQDFSVTLPVEKAAPWPECQRFDYLVRRTEVPKMEATASAATGHDYPQRRAVLFALHELTGGEWHDHGGARAIPSQSKSASAGR
jgi:hypothetical protein